MMVNYLDTISIFTTTSMTKPAPLVSLYILLVFFPSIIENPFVPSDEACGAKYLSLQKLLLALHLHGFYINGPFYSNSFFLFPHSFDY